MKPALIFVNFLAWAVLAALGLSSAASAGTLYLDNNSTIGGYTTATPVPASPLTSPTYGIASGLGSGITAGVTGMAWDAVTGEILVANYGSTVPSGSIDAYTLQGAESAFAPLSSITNPVGIAVDSAGDVFVGASEGASLVEYNSSTTDVTTVKSSLSNDIQALAVNAAGDVFAALANQTVAEFVGSSETTLAGVTLGGTVNTGMTFDNSGDLFITYAQASGGGIDEISASGDFSVLYSTATDLPAGSGTELPTGIAYDYLTGDLYMSYTASFSSARGGGIVVIPDESGTLVATDAKVFATIASDTQGAGAGGIVDPTPEPGTLFLSGLGLAISLFYLRRKNLAVIPQS